MSHTESEDAATALFGAVYPTMANQSGKMSEAQVDLSLAFFSPRLDLAQGICSPTQAILREKAKGVARLEGGRCEVDVT